MAKLPNDYDWRRSQGHIFLLRLFTSPRIIDIVNEPRYEYKYLNESVSKAFDRLLRDGALEVCSLSEKLGYVYKVTDLRAKLKAHGKKTGGSKDELIQQLLQLEYSKLSMEMDAYQVYKCSTGGKLIFERYEQEKDAALALAKKIIYESLIKLEIIQARKTYAEYLKIWEPSQANYDSDYQFSNLRRMLEKSPKRLAEKYDKQSLRKLQAAAAMDLFWRDEPGWRWLSDDLGLEAEEIEQSMQLTKRYQKYLDLIEEWSFQQNEIRFGQDNPNVCDNCRRLEGVKLDKKKALEWPFEGCTNPTGCLPLRSYELQRGEEFEREDAELPDEGEEENDNSEEVRASLPQSLAVDYFNLLRQLKYMLDDGLITAEEYQAKKADILSRI